LEGLELDTNKSERVPPPSDEALKKARYHAEAWAKHVGVSIIDDSQLIQFASEAESRTLYLLDVRDPEEYAVDHPKGFISAPGGQLVQATDEWVGVRGARIVLYDTDGVRARMTASWLHQLGWEVHVLNGQSPTPQHIQLPLIPSWQPSSKAITPEELRQLPDYQIVDLARSPTYRRGHIHGAWHASGPELGRDLTNLPGNKGSAIILTSPDGLIAAANVEHAQKVTDREVLYLEGGTEAWTKAGYNLSTKGQWLSEPIDVYKRPYEGTTNARKDMEAYIEWEHGLVAQLANDGVSCFNVVRRERIKP
jgi:rhodanese-related sulfurtransferase